jgi:hypothetical protein
VTAGGVCGAIGVLGVVGCPWSRESANREPGSCGHEGKPERKADYHHEARPPAWRPARSTGCVQPSVNPFELVGRERGALTPEEFANVAKTSVLLGIEAVHREFYGCDARFLLICHQNFLLGGAIVAPSMYGSSWNFDGGLLG